MSSDPFDFDEAPPMVPAPPPPKPSGRFGAPQPVALDGLNESQRRAVEAVNGPVLVLAGAGTGKTRVLTTRLAHILTGNHARPGEILAVTFTNKAAREMKDRVASLIDRPVEGWWVGTFHALAARILRSHAEIVGLKSNFTILDDDDQIRLLKQIMDIVVIDDKRWPARTMLGVIQRWKDRGLTPDKVTAAEGADTADGKALTIYQDYQQRLRQVNAADFGDLLLHCLTVMQKDPAILAHYQQLFRYILVDEYQDTNVCQYLWLRMLAQGHRNICCVGDDDQSIYSWRGAEVGNILRFEKDFPGAAVVRLERNYRSTSHILGAASGLIANNEDRLGKTLWTDVGDGSKVRVSGVWDGEEEARTVGDDIEVLQDKGHPLNEIAVLVRAGFQTREFEDRLLTLGVPYRVVGGLRFYERKEIRDAIAYLRVVFQRDDDLAFERIINVPKRGIGKAAMQTIHGFARAQRLPLTMAVEKLLETDEISAKARKSLALLMDDFGRWRSLVGVMDHAELTGMILDESSYTQALKDDKSPEAPGRLDNLKELVSAMEEFENLQTFLEHVSLVMENEEARGTDKVSLMTLHGAKGLEFDTVFLPGWEEGLFPHQRAMDEGGLKGLEEERRLAYVGLTRAKKRATILFAANRRVYGQWQSAIPSRFVDELPEDHVEAVSDSGLYQRGGRSRRGGQTDPHALATFDAVQPLTDSGSWKVAARDQGSGIQLGQRIFHQKFGYGMVISIDGDKLEINFEKAGQKMVMASFVQAVSG